MKLPKQTPYLLLILLIFICHGPADGQIQQIRQELHRQSFIKDSVSISMVNSLNRLGTLYRSRNADSCFYYGMKAKQMATNIKYRLGQTDADHVIAFALFKKGLYAESLELLGKLLAQYQQLGDAEKTIQVYLDMIEVENKGISDKAKIISLLHQAIQTGRKLEKDSLMAEVYMRYINRGPDLSEDSIRYYLNKSREIATRYKDESLLIFNQLWQANLLISNDRKEEALPLIQQSLAKAQHIGNANLEFNTLVTLLNYEDDFQKELEYLYQEYEVVQKSGDKYLEIYILNSALEVAKDLKDKDEIIRIYEQLEKAMTEEWENSKKFISDYIQFNAIQDENKLLNEKNKRRALWIVILSFSALITVFVIYLIMLRRNRKAKAQIDTLNNVANMQIIAMEEIKHEAIREEQQRLGQDLHDGLSSSIASIKHQLETLTLDTEDTRLKNKLGMLQAQVANAYETARNKSHEWFNATEEQQEQSFQQRVKLLADSALPDSRYNKDIHIDEGALSQVSVDTRIALLRIIQEAITNIIKHAKATVVEILVYEDIENLVTMIKDNGKGLAKHDRHNRNSAMGIQSIRRRAQLLNGELDIHSEGHGTEIIVTIPLSRAGSRRKAET